MKNTVLKKKSNLYYYKYENVCLSVCLFVHLATGDSLYISSSGDTAEMSCGVENELNIQVISATWMQTNTEHPDYNPNEVICSGADVTAKVAER